MRGLVLAFIAVIPFPLLLLNAAIYGVLYFLTSAFLPDVPIFMLTMTGMLWMVADISYIYLAWRIVSWTGEGADYRSANIN